MIRLFRHFAGSVCVVGLACVIYAGLLSGQSSAAGVETATLTHGDGREQVIVPTPLSDADAERYVKIFKLQETGKWPDADLIISKLTNRLLIGHVQFQRYMHPTAYRSKYVELRNWLSEYADHPGAERVYKLALRRKPKSWKAPTRPIGVVGLKEVGAGSEQIAEDDKKIKPPTRWKSRFVYRIQRKVKSLVSRGRPTQALKLISSATNRRRIDPVSFDESVGIIARGYFHAGKNREALKVALVAIERSGIKTPNSYWWGGLAAWRLDQFGTAARLFEGLTHVNLDWTTSAAAYWAARAYLIDKQPQHHNRLLAIAAQRQQTFYGMLALHALGLEPDFNWDLPKLDELDTQLLSRIPAANRSLALIQVKQFARAETELRRLTGNLSPQLARSLLALAEIARLPALALNLGDTLMRHKGERYQAALFPVPAWAPENGYRVDRALLFALMRQESRFKTNAKSRAGARGLMQLMPATAGFIAGKRIRGSARNKLFEPQYNIELGQKYIEHLMATPDIGTNLFLVTAAYNGGPGNLKKWKEKTDFKNDPLLFIESLPVRETRNFIERVLTNFWYYRYRLNQTSPSLMATVKGSWPEYISLDLLEPDTSKVATSAD